jgi:hypothetical protein
MSAFRNHHRRDRFLEFFAHILSQKFRIGSEQHSDSFTAGKHIKKLEKELQVSLFDRNTRKVSLTPFGKCLIPYARSIVETEKNFLEDLEKKIQAQSSQLVQCLKSKKNQ